MKDFDVSRFVSLLSAAIFLVFLGFAFGLHSYSTRNFAYGIVSEVGNTLRNLTAPQGRDRLDLGWTFEHIQPALSDASGVTVNARPEDGARILMVGFFDDENQARLVDRNGEVVHKWSLDFFRYFPTRSSQVCKLDDPLAEDIHGAVLTPRGELVVNYEYCGTVKLDMCGNPLWTLARQTHHSITRASDGGYWILDRLTWLESTQPDRFPPFTRAGGSKDILEDLIVRVSETGEIVEQYSIPQILYDSGLEALFTATGQAIRSGGADRSELVHANKVGELSASLAERFPTLNAGDLVISLRHLNLIAVLDAETKLVKWHRIGPWLRQHDPEFRPDGTISVFNNNTYNTQLDPQGHRVPTAPLVSNIMTVDPATDEIRVIYGQAPGQEFLSVIRGQHELLPDGGMLITAFDEGRVVEVDATGRKVWEYVNRYNADFVGEIANAMRFDPGYFEVDLGTCD